MNNSEDSNTKKGGGGVVMVSEIGMVCTYCGKHSGGLVCFVCVKVLGDYDLEVLYDVSVW